MQYSFRRTKHELQSGASRGFGIACGLLAAAIWGLLQASGRAAVIQGLSPFDLAALRFGVAGALLLPWLLTSGRSAADLAGVGLPRAFVLTLCLGPPFFLLNMAGYRFSPLAHGVVILPAVFIVAGLAGAHYFLGDRLSARKAIGCAVVFCGLLAIANNSSFATEGDLTALGDVMFAAAGLLWCAASLLISHWKLNSMQTTAAVAVLSAGVYLPAYAAFGTPGQLAAVPLEVLAFHVLASGVLAGVVAMLAFTRSVAILGAGGSAIFPALVPAMGTLIGYALTGEVPGPAQIAGLLLVSAGLIVAVK